MVIFQLYTVWRVLDTRNKLPYELLLAFEYACGLVTIECKSYVLVSGQHMYHLYKYSLLSWWIWLKVILKNAISQLNEFVCEIIFLFEGNSIIESMVLFCQFKLAQLACIDFSTLYQPSLLCHLSQGLYCISSLYCYLHHTFQQVMSFWATLAFACSARWLSPFDSL